MADITVASTDSIWRFGFYAVDISGHRWFASETWHFTVQWPSPLIAGFSAAIVDRLRQPFGPGETAADYRGVPQLLEQIHPVFNNGVVHTNLSPVNRCPLNINAPEAAFRLQRVGASGIAGPKGRICLPILNDTVFTDLPHRRHVAAVDLQTLLDAHLNLRFFNTGIVGFGLPPIGHCVIFHRRTLTATKVTRYIIQKNPCRIWQRWHHYPQPGHDIVSDGKFMPDGLLTPR